MPDKAIGSRRSAGEPHDPNRELDFLNWLGETIGAMWNADLIPGMALEVSLEITDADLVDRIVSPRRDRVRPAVITELPIASKSYSWLMWAPLVVAETSLGGILLGHRPRRVASLPPR